MQGGQGSAAVGPSRQHRITHASLTLVLYQFLQSKAFVVCALWKFYATRKCRFSAYECLFYINLKHLLRFDLQINIKNGLFLFHVIKVQ